VSKRICSSGVEGSQGKLRPPPDFSSLIVSTICTTTAGLLPCSRYGSFSYEFRYELYRHGRHDRTWLAQNPYLRINLSCPALSSSLLAQTCSMPPAPHRRNNSSHQSHLRSIHLAIDTAQARTCLLPWPDEKLSFGSILTACLGGQGRGPNV